MSRVVVFGTGQFAQLAHFYLTHDSPYEVVGFTVDSEYLAGTEFLGLPVAGFEEMTEFFQAMVARVFGFTAIGIVFNVMSKHVDWERDDLFHLPFDNLAAFLKTKISDNFVIRNDYGLYEYAVYVYR